jgi:prepilin-type N-terminal cleavage/methylation domain-containing protein
MHRQFRERRAGARVRSDDGMTLIEVMVSMLVLVAVVLGLFSLLDTSTAVTRANLSRDGATGLAREQIERARDIAYASLADPSKVAGALAPAIEGSSAPTAAAFTTVRRHITYSTVITSCVLDDPSDGIGVATGTPCNPLPVPSGGGGTVSTPGSGSSIQLNVLGITVTGAGTVVDAVCSLIGRNSVLDGLIGATSAKLSGLVSTGAGVGLCTSGSRQVAVDRQAADATAVTTTVTWSRPRPGKVVQRTVVAGPRT